MNDRLYRSVHDRVIAGVCGGLAVRLGMDPSLVRIGYIIVALVTGIVPLLVLYLIMAAVVPEEPAGFSGVGPSPAPPGPDAVPGWAPPTPTGGWPVTDESGVPEPVAGTPRADEPFVPTPSGTRAAGSGGAAWSRPQLPRRSGDPLLAVIGGLALVGLGVYFLVRDQVTVDWSVVWAAALMALGVVIVVAAFVRPRR